MEVTRKYKNSKILEFQFIQFDLTNVNSLLHSELTKMVFGWIFEASGSQLWLDIRVSLFRNGPFFCCLGPPSKEFDLTGLGEAYASILKQKQKQLLSYF